MTYSLSFRRRPPGDPQTIEMELLVLTNGEITAGDDDADVIEMEPLVITADEDSDVIEMEPLIITPGEDESDVIEMEALEITPGEDTGAGESEEGDDFAGLGIPPYLSALLDDLLTPEAAADGVSAPVEESTETDEDEETEGEAIELDAGEDEEAAPESEVEVPAEEVVIEEAMAEAETEAGAPEIGVAEPADEDPDAALRQWQGGVNAAGGAIPAPTLGEAGAAQSGITQAGATRGSAQAARRREIPRRARAVTPPAPEVESPPPPPSSNPIPEYTQRIEAASSGENRRLPKRTMPVLVTRAGGTPPRAGDTPVDPRIFQLAMNPQNLALLPDTEAGRRDRALVEQAQKAFSAEPPAVTEGPPAPVNVEDEGAPPIPPLPPQLATPVGRVVARLLAQPEEASNRVMRQLKRGAYPNAVLTNDETFGTVGQALLPTLRTEMVAELRRVAQAAGVSADQLDTMVRERQTELENERRQASSATTEATRSARSTVGEEGARTLGTITETRRQLDEEAIRRQEAASGGTDPTVIEARRSQVVSWVRDRVTSEITNFQRQGDARTRSLDSAVQTQSDAYNAAAQRDEYRLLNQPTPLSQRPADEQRRLQDEALLIRNFARDQIQTVRTQINGWKTEDASTIRGWRTTIETAGTEAIQAARRWADGRVEEGRSWWERIVNRITGWRERAQEAAITWEARTTTETRDLIAGDLQYISRLEQQVREGATRESLLANQSLGAEQRAIIEAYFAPNASRNPLDIVATRLEVQIARQQQANATRNFEQDLLSPATDWHALNLVGAAQRAGFDASVVAGAVHDAVAGWGTNEAKIYSNLAGLTPIQVAAVRRNYERRYGETLDEALSDDLSDDELRRAELLLAGDQRAADAYALHYAVDQWGTDEETIMNVLRNQTPEQRRAIIEYYNANFDPDLQSALRGDMSGHELDRAMALSEGNIAEADAIALDEAMRGGFFWGAGTNEGQIEQTYQTIRNEVLAQAQREGWTSAQMEAEVRRRNREVETAFNRRYANVEQYRAPDGNATGSVLQRAFRSELSGPELDLANALNENDLARADAARIEIERQSVVYADDEKINDTLRGQYERALQAVRLDQGPERRHQMETAMQEWRRTHPNASANDMSREQMRLEREMDRAMERAAQERSRVSMQELEQVYSDQYNGRNLRVTLAMNMSGDELARARLLVNQGGYLTPYQELDFATRSLGTDEARLRQSLEGRTRAEIQQIREEWERRHPGQNFDNFLRGELSGREEFEIMDTVEHGAPESALGRMEQIRRQMEHQLDHGAPLGGSVATGEAAYLREEMARLNQMSGDLTRTDLSDEERERLLFEFSVQATVTDEAVQDHQRAVDRITDLATQIVGIATAIIVGTVLTIVSGGALGPVMIGLIASAASTLATMGTKYALKGDDYGIEEIGTDLAVGVVDAIASAATAGVGSAIVGRFLRGAGGAATSVAASTARAAARTGGNRVSQALSRMATRVARGTGLSRLNQLPRINRATSAIGRFARAEEGSLARMIRGGARESAESAALRAANERAMSTSTRLFSEVMAESLDNVIQSAPSAFTASVLNDDNWHGNVILNILGSTGQQVGQGMVMSSAMLGGRMLGRGARAGVGAIGERWRMRTPEGRIAEGSRRMGSAYMDWVAENPAGSYNDFLNSSTGQSLRRDLEARNMLPTAADLDSLPPTRVPGDTAPSPRLVEGENAAPPPEGVGARGEGARGEGAASPARTADAEATVRGAEADAASTPRPVEGEGGPGARGESARGEGPVAPRSGDPQAEALRGGLPERMRERVPVEVNPNLPEGEVRVVPIREDGRIVGVRVEAGPGATATDVMLHAHVVQGYERYIGLLGRARDLIERFNAWFNLREHAGVGTAAFEARLEIQKLPAVIEERMARLSQGGLDPAAQARLLADINNLTRQIDAHHTRLNDFGEGRGFVAAEGLPATRRSEDADVVAQRERYQDRDAAQLRADTETLTTRRQEALETRTAVEDRLVAAREQLQPLQRQHEAAQGRVRRAEHEVGVAERQAQRGKPTPEAAQQRLDAAKEELRLRRQEVETVGNTLTELQTTIRTETQRLADATTAFRQASAELSGALEARQGRLGEDFNAVQRQIDEVQAATLRDVEAVPHVSETAAEVAARNRIEDLEIQLEALKDGGGKLAMQQRLEREIDAAQAELRGLQQDRLRERAAQVDAIQRRADERIKQLRDQMTALEREINPVIQQTLEVQRSGDWTVQGYNDLGVVGVEPCFAPHTLVKTPSGNRAIADLGVGDDVLSFDGSTQTVTAQRVTRIWRNWTDQFVVVHLGAETILATGNHPFWVDDAQIWSPARALHREAQLRAADGQRITVTQIGAALDTSFTYNLEVESTHTYFVGERGVLVHNRSVNADSKFLRTRQRPTTIYVIWDVTKTPRVPLYVGKTYQSTDGTARFEQHLSEGNDDIEASRKRQWAEMHARGELVMEPVRSGSWTEFETAVWEQHFIRLHNGGEDIKPDSNLLQNRRNEITPETYRTYKNEPIELPDGSTFRHNPCR